MSEFLSIINKALENVKDRPAAYTILVLMILLGYFNLREFEDESLKFWIAFSTYIVLAITLISAIFIPLRNSKPNLPDQNGSENYFSKLIDTRVFNESVKYEIEFKEVVKEGIWIRVFIEQVARNNGSEPVNKTFRINSYDRKCRNEQIRQNSIRCDLSIFAESRTKKGLALEYTIQENSTYSISYDAEILYEKIDYDLFLTFSPAKRFEVAIQDNLDCGSGQIEYYIDKKFVDNQNNRIIDENSRKTIVLEEGALPFNGISLKWKTI